MFFHVKKCYIYIINGLMIVSDCFLILSYQTRLCSEFLECLLWGFRNVEHNFCSNGEMKPSTTIKGRGYPILYFCIWYIEYNWSQLNWYLNYGKLISCRNTWSKPQNIGGKVTNNLHFTCNNFVMFSAIR